MIRLGSKVRQYDGFTPGGLVGRGGGSGGRRNGLLGRKITRVSIFYEPKRFTGDATARGVSDMGGGGKRASLESDTPRKVNSELRASFQELKPGEPSYGNLFTPPGEWQT